MTDSKSPGDRLLELMVFGPAGLAVTIVEEFPRLVEKGRHRVEGQVHTARLVGQFAVQMGRRQLEESLGHLGARPGDQAPGARCRDTATRPDPSPGPTRGSESQAPSARAGGRACRRALATLCLARDRGRQRQRRRGALVPGHSGVRQLVRVAGGAASRGVVASRVGGGARPRGRASAAAYHPPPGRAAARRRGRRGALTATERGGPVEGTRPARREDAERCAELCQDALDGLQRARGGPLFARRETGLIAKALLRPGGLDRLLADSRRRVLVGTVDDSVVGMALGRIEEVGETRLGVIDAAMSNLVPVVWAWAARCSRSSCRGWRPRGAVVSTSARCPVTATRRTSWRRRGSRPVSSPCTAPWGDRDAPGPSRHAGGGRGRSGRGRRRAAPRATGD